MGFLDSLFGGGATGQIKKHGRRMADRNAQTEDRESSAQWLSENGSEAALRALCGRFGLQLEHSLKDQKEKDRVLDLLVGHGAVAVGVAKDYARTTPSFQWPLKLVDRLEGSAAGTEMLLELLSHERVEEEFRVEKKRNLLINLAERKDPRIVAAAGRFLVDFDEGVRHGAIEAIAAQAGDEAREPLGAALARQDEESTRIRGRLAEIFALRRWPVEDPDGWLAANMPHGYRVLEGRVVATR
jgi:hypothetical protein